MDARNARAVGHETVARGRWSGGRCYLEELDGAAPWTRIWCWCWYCWGGMPIPPVTELQQQAPPPVMHAMSMGPQVPPAQAPPPQNVCPNQHMHMPVDPGVNSAGGLLPLSGTDSPSYARPAARPPGQRTDSMSSPALPPDIEGPGGQGQEAFQAPPPQHPAVKGPTALAEMGVQGVKPEGNECVIM